MNSVPRYGVNNALGQHIELTPEKVIALRALTKPAHETGDPIVDMLAHQVDCLSLEQRIKLLAALADTYPTDMFVTNEFLDTPDHDDLRQ